MRLVEGDIGYVDARHLFVEVLLARLVGVRELHLCRAEDGVGFCQRDGIVSLREEGQVDLGVGEHLVLSGDKTHDESILAHRQVRRDHDRLKVIGQRCLLIPDATGKGDGGQEDCPQDRPAPARDELAPSLSMGRLVPRLGADERHSPVYSPFCARKAQRSAVRQA